jgi:hypothetical protein
MKRLSATMWVSLGALVLLAVLALVLHFAANLPILEFLAWLSLAFVFVVAFVQQFHLWSLERVSKQTAEIAERLQMAAWLKENVRDFFGISIGEKKQYECVFPIEFSHKPLPLLNAGDYYALQVLSNRLGADNLLPNPCLRGKRAKISLDNVICICAPDANPVTRDLFNPNDDMPCWIKSRATKGKCLRIKKKGSKVELLDSPSEKFYVEAAGIYATKKDKSAPVLYRKFIAQKTYEDYGILARVTEGAKRYVLIAGLHQPGTWIVTAYLDDILANERGAISSIFLEAYDFAAVIWGEFEGTSLEVLDKRIHKDYLWQKRAGQWQRVPLPSI